MHLLQCGGEPSANLRRYLWFGQRHGVDKRYVCRHRAPWYSVEKRAPAPILATAFSRGSMRFIRNRAGCLHLAAYHGVHPRRGGDDAAKALLAYLNSGHCQSNQGAARREYGGGLHKFEPGYLSELPVVPVSRLGAGTVAELARLFDGLCGGAQGARERLGRGVAGIVSRLGTPARRRRPLRVRPDRPARCRTWTARERAGGPRRAPDPRAGAGQL